MKFKNFVNFYWNEVYLTWSKLKLPNTYFDGKLHNIFELIFFCFKNRWGLLKFHVFKTQRHGAMFWALLLCFSASTWPAPRHYRHLIFPVTSARTLVSVTIRTYSFFFCPFYTTFSQKSFPLSSSLSIFCDFWRLWAKEIDFI